MLNPATIPTSEFSKDIKNVARSLRASLSALMTSVGLDPQDPQTLMRRWGVNKTLSWKISRVIQTDDAFLALQQVPGREGIEVLLRKGETAGVESRFLVAIKEAVNEFERVIETHCGDRATFEMMASDLTPLGRQQREEHHRKQLFQGASYVWGVQARMYLAMRFVAPSVGNPETADIASVVGLLDFRRLRENVRWIMSRRYINHGDGTPITLANAEPVDPASAGQIVPLMPQFCSEPQLPLNIIREGNVATIELTPGKIGNAGVLTYFAGAIERGYPNVRTLKDEFADLWAISSTPAELLMFDIYIHESMTYAIPPTPLLSSMLGSLPSGRPGHDHNQLPLLEPLLDLGAASPGPVTPEVPRYDEILQTVFSRAGWSPSEFHAFRIKIAYPPIPAALSMRYRLPE